MGDDFTGVPSGSWWELRERVAGHGFALLAIASLLALLILVLVGKGVIAWPDLIPGLHG